MRKILVVAAAAVVCLPMFTPSVSAQAGAAQSEAPNLQQARRQPPLKGPVPRLPNGKPDLFDMAWIGGGSGGGNIETQGGLKKGELDALMLPEAKALMAKRDVTKDPHNFCMPDVVPRTTPFPWRFVQNYTHKDATHIFIVNEGNIHSFRQIFLDGRKHPPDLAPSWYGHSIGWWEGDTLVIDTVGFNGMAWLDGQGRPATEKLHTVERWTRLDLGRLENKVTIDDPGAYSKPWTVTFTARALPGDDILEYICQENNQFGSGLN